MFLKNRELRVQVAKKNRKDKNPEEETTVFAETDQIKAIASHLAKKGVIIVAGFIVLKTVLDTTSKVIVERSKKTEE